MKKSSSGLIEGLGNNARPGFGKWEGNKTMSDALGDRMKERYENRTRYFLPRRTYTILRVDGKAFHTYCRGMERPYSAPFMSAMDATALVMCMEIMGTEFAYVQSDEISVLMTDFAKPNTDAWFDGNIQKMCSVGASMASGCLAEAISAQGMALGRMPMFDARVFTIPDHIEVENYFIWRQQDAVRNSIQMLAQHYYSPKELHKKNCSELQEMIQARSDNWNDHPARFKRGGLVWYDRAAMPYPEWKVGEAVNFTGESERVEFRKLIPLQWAESEERMKDYKANWPQWLKHQP